MKTSNGKQIDQTLWLRGQIEKMVPPEKRVGIHVIQQLSDNSLAITSFLESQVVQASKLFNELQMEPTNRRGVAFYYWQD